LSAPRSASDLKDLSILPTCGTKFYRYDGAWQKLYSEDFSVDDKEKIVSGLNKAIDQSGFRAVKHRKQSVFTQPGPRAENVICLQCHGTVDNVVFPTGVDRRDDLGAPDRFDIYYGMADESHRRGASRRACNAAERVAAD
jgi:hypothetical protein